MNRTILPASQIHGDITVPGDKSVSHRAVILGAIAEGDTLIRGLSPGQDVTSTRRCFESLGVKFEDSTDGLIIHGAGKGGLNAPSSVLDAGNSGTTIRLLSGILAAQPFNAEISGDESLRRRPMKRVVEPLARMGAMIETADGRPPLRIVGRPLSGISYDSPVASGQIKSCVLLAGLYANGRTFVTEPSLSRDHTERMFPGFGVEVVREGLKVGVSGPARLHGSKVDVPGDLSSAAFFMLAASLTPGSHLVARNVGVNPTRTGIIAAIRNMGGSVELENERIENGEPRADLVIRSRRLSGIRIEGDLIPELIDEIPLLAVAATQAEGETVIRNAGELRVKESDRIDAVAAGLERMGAEVATLDDGFIIVGPQKLKGASVDSFGDHRIAMAFAVAGLWADGPTVIEKAECVDISFPGFFEMLGGLVHG
jgi:3-phosphoshikimate 1-carboxyvinyltransferase